jgi:hypothetical protein
LIDVGLEYPSILFLVSIVVCMVAGLAILSLCSLLAQSGQKRAEKPRGNCILTVGVFLQSLYAQIELFSGFIVVMFFPWSLGSLFSGNLRVEVFH